MNTISASYLEQSDACGAGIDRYLAFVNHSREPQPVASLVHRDFPVTDLVWLLFQTSGYQGFRDMLRCSFHQMLRELKAGYPKKVVNKIKQATLNPSFKNWLRAMKASERHWLIHPTNQQGREVHFLTQQYLRVTSLTLLNDFSYHHKTKEKPQLVTAGSIFLLDYMSFSSDTELPYKILRRTFSPNHPKNQEIT